MNKPTQEQLFSRSKVCVPGGVHSPVRSFKGLPMTPRFIQSGDGAFITDTDGKDYIDFCMSFGPLILGHKNPSVHEALQGALDKGWSYGACEPYSLELAEFLVSKIPHIDQIRFVNSGTEAVMTALRLARGVTKREKVLKFDGCYHGHLDSMLIKAGSGLAGEAEASSDGVTQEVAKNTLICDLNDLEGLKKVFEEYGNELAAVALEPLPANNGLLPIDPDFMTSIVSLARKHGVLILFDEVISGFRASFQGMAGELAITPDLVTYGKIIGGGLPVGAVAGKKEIMEHLAPLGPVYQAGTLSANPLAMAGGLATLKHLNDQAYKDLENNTKNICDLMKQWFKEFDGGKFKDFQIAQSHSLFWIHKGDLPHSPAGISPHIMEDFIPLFSELLERGIYLAPNPYEVGFCSLAHGPAVQQEMKERLWR